MPVSHKPALTDKRENSSRDKEKSTFSQGTFFSLRALAAVTRRGKPCNDGEGSFAKRDALEVYCVYAF
jgi:hypothetical protein